MALCNSLPPIHASRGNYSGHPLSHGPTGGSGRGKGGKPDTGLKQKSKFGHHCGMNNRNLLKGIFLVAISLVFGIGALKYNIGKVERAGPGFFPLMVSSILFVLGALMIIRSLLTDKVPFTFNVKNIVIILGSLAAFALLSQHINMLTGIVAMVFISTLAGTSYSIKRNALICAFLIAIAFVFQKGLGLQLPLY